MSIPARPSHLVRGKFYFRREALRIYYLVPHASHCSGQSLADGNHKFTGDAEWIHRSSLR